MVPRLRSSSLPPHFSFSFFLDKQAFDFNNK